MLIIWSSFKPIFFVVSRWLTRCEKRFKVLGLDRFLILFKSTKSRHGGSTCGSKSWWSLTAQCCSSWRCRLAKSGHHSSCSGPCTIFTLDTLKIILRLRTTHPLLLVCGSWSRNISFYSFDFVLLNSLSCWQDVLDFSTFWMVALELITHISVNFDGIHVFSPLGFNFSDLFLGQPSFALLRSLNPLRLLWFNIFDNFHFEFRIFLIKNIINIKI